MQIRKMTADQKLNLLRLRDFIKDLDPINFNMSVYCDTDVSQAVELSLIDDDDTWLYEDDDYRYQMNFSELQKVKQNKHTCNTHMCLIGWSYNIPDLVKQLEGKKTYSWADLASNLYGCDNSDSNSIGPYLFAAAWGEDEGTNTIAHAIYRINRVLAAVTTEDYLELVKEMEDTLGGAYCIFC